MMRLLVTHGSWGVIALPPLSMPYVRANDVAAFAEQYKWEFRTKHEQAMDLVTWFVGHARSMQLTCSIWLVMDRAYVSRQTLKAMAAQ